MTDSAAVPFGRYTLIKRIARGGMAEIFLAKQVGPGKFERSLVIKRILPALVEQGSKFTQMFLDEASLAAQLSHPHIAQVYDFGEEEGSYFLALELVKGPDLRTLIRTAQKLNAAPPPLELAIKIIAEVAGALDYAHHAKSESGQALHIVHRDVSPQNVLVSYDGVTKLVDFGIAKAATASTETEAGVVKGKYAYFTPEQIRKLVLDGRTDEYALALVLYELLTLRQALPGQGMEAMMAAADGRVTPIAKVRPDLPADLVMVIERALAKDRDERYPTCRDFQTDLEGLLVNWGMNVAQHDIAAYLAELERANGEPLSAAVSQGHTPGGGARPQRDDDTNPRLKAYTPAPAAVRQRTGSRPALDAGARPRTQNRMAALDLQESSPTLLRAPAGADEGEPTERRPAEKKRTNPAARALPAANLDDPTLPPGRVKAFVDEPPKRRETPPVDVAAAAVPRPKEKSSGLGRFLVFVLFMAAAVGGMGYKFGLRPADFKGVHDLAGFQRVLETKLADKPPPPVAAVPLKPPEPPPSLLPAAAVAAAEPAKPVDAALDAGVTVAPPPEQPKTEAPRPHKADKPHPKIAAKPAQAKPSGVVETAAPVETPDAPPPPPATGTVIFSVKPWANVSVNGKQLGQSPLPAEELPAGTYAAEFKNPQTDHVVQKRFTVVGGEQITVVVDMTKD